MDHVVCLPFTYLRIKQVSAALGGRSESQIWADVKAGKFPAPEKVGCRSLWRSDVVAAWLLEQSRQAQVNREAIAKAIADRNARLALARKEHRAAA